MHSLLLELEFLEKEQRRRDECIQDYCRRLGEKSRIQKLRMILGLGLAVVHRFAVEIFNPQRFCRQEEAAYLDLAPVAWQGGEKQGEGPTTACRAEVIAKPAHRNRVDMEAEG